MDIKIETLRNAIIGEIFLSLGFSKTGFAFKAFGWLFWKPAERVSQLGINLDRMISEEGVPKATTWLLNQWCDKVISRGRESIPSKGPLLIISNHAGTYDSFVISSEAGRKDFSLIASDVPFLKNLPNLSQHIFYLSDDPYLRMVSARQGIRHLKKGGMLLIYGTGLIDPDPEIYPDAEPWIDKWLSSIDLFLAQVPETKVVFSIVSGVVSSQWAYHPVTKLKRVDWQKRRLAEFGQMIYQLFFPGRLYLTPHISFSQPLGYSELTSSGYGKRILPAAITQGKKLLADHMAWVNSLPKE